MKKIVVLLHKEDAAFTSANYSIKLMMKEWESMGLTAEVVRGTDHFVPADVIIPHVNLTVTPNEYRDFLSQYPVVINRHVIDISKAKVSTHIIGKEDTYSGPVIVKTDRNYGGLPERRLLSELRRSPQISSSLIGKIMSKLRRNRAGSIAWRYVEYLNPVAYPVFPSLQHVPKDIFDNTNLVVEKFLPEVEGGKYCLRCYFFFGDKEVNTLLRSNERVVKAANSCQVEGASTPPELYSTRQRLGFDYGKFDYVLRDGKVVLFDVNRTPTIEASQLGQKAARHLAEGIWSKLN